MVRSMDKASSEETLTIAVVQAKRPYMPRSQSNNLGEGRSRRVLTYYQDRARGYRG